jgi:hypothetical protein
MHKGNSLMSTRINSVQPTGLRRLSPSGMRRRVALVRTDVSEQRIASIFSEKIISKVYIL